MIEISGMYKAHGQFEVVKGVDLGAGKGEVLSIISDSSSGKSILLMCINGLESIQCGSIRIDGIDVHTRGTDLNRLWRKVGIVFQQWNASPYLIMLESVMLASRKVLGKSRVEAEAMTPKQLTHVGLGDKLEILPQHLFGGQQRHVAIARALAMSPDYMLFGGATSALDPQLVGEMLDTMRLLAEEGMTMILAIHETRFARNVSDRVAFFRNGLVHEIGAPDQVINDPQWLETMELLRSVL